MRRLIYRLIFVLGTTLATAPSLTSAQEKESPPAEKQDDAKPVIVKEAKVTPKRIPGSVDRATAPGSIKSKMELLGDNFSEKEGRWIGDNEPFFVVWQADRSGKAKGALLILHAEGEHPSWPQTTKPLHDTLPEYGWATLAISLPSPPKEAVPERTLPPKSLIDKGQKEKKTEPAQQNTAKDSTKEDLKSKDQEKKNLGTKNPGTKGPIKKPAPRKNATQEEDQFNQKMEQRLTAAIKFLHDQGQFNLAMIGHGTNAIHAERFMQSITPKITDKKLKERFEKPIRALLLYNASNTLSNSKQGYNEWFHDPEIPIMDIYSSINQHYAESVKTRKILSKKKKVKTYVSLKLTEMSYETTWGENRLSRRIRSFLDAHVKGIEVKNAKVKK